MLKFAQERQVSRVERTYDCSIVGDRCEDRATYIRRFVTIGDPVALIRELNNRFDGMAVAVYHHDFKVGYVPPCENRWVYKSIEENNEHEAMIVGLCEDEDLFALDVEIKVVDGSLAARGG